LLKKTIFIVSCCIEPCRDSKSDLDSSFVLKENASKMELAKERAVMNAKWDEADRRIKSE
jgi:hypothetical protein